MRVRFENIAYDTDGKKIENLPKVLEGSFETDFDPPTEGADFISDQTGWCVESFTFAVLEA